MSYKEEYEYLCEMIEAKLSEYFKDALPQKGLFEAMRYSLLAGGKRIRPLLVLKFCQASGGEVEKALPYACAIEMIHTYSLIHDDLPCMDNDDLRRGKPTCHKVFGEGTAAIAGDALQAAAFRVILSTDDDYAVKASAGLVLSSAAGEVGMCGGQYLDTVEDGKIHSVSELEVINDMKTGALLSAACEMGIVAAGKYNDETLRKEASRYGLLLARAFQIRDDVLDIIADEKVFGKSVGSDAENKKSTFASILGIEACEELINEYSDKAENVIRKSFNGDEFLISFTDSMRKRTF